MYRVPYSKTHLEFDLPPGMRGHLVESKHVPPIADVPAAVAEAIAEPIDSPPLTELARPGDRVCIVFTDVTRASPDAFLVPPILRALEQAGVRDEDITLLCGIGMHRPSTPAEKVAKLGQAVVDRYTVIDNEPQNPDALVDLGVVHGIPLSVHNVAYQADLLIATGSVDPHQYAGYSGGPKTVAVGAAGEALIEYSHGPRFMDDPNVRLGKLAGNPFQEAVREAASRAGLRFIVNAVLDDEARAVAVMAGAPGPTHARLVEFARSIYEVAIPRQYDAAICGVGYPKDANLYQATRGASNLHFGPMPAVRPGGYLHRARALPGRGGRGGGRGALFPGHGRRARRGVCAGRWAQERLSARPAARFCDGQAVGGQQGHFCGHRAPRGRRGLQNDPRRDDRGGAVDGRRRPGARPGRAGRAARHAHAAHRFIGETG